jgi:L-alanine-DL-glutamate epimerase-like enolase superfamily enzyme
MDPTTTAPEPPTAVELWWAPVPLERPVVTPAGTFDTYHHLVVLAIGEDGHTGWGMAAGVTPADLEACTERALTLLDHAGGGTHGLVATEAVEAGRTVTPPDRWSRWAACALATAGWELRARRLGVACAELWGRRPGTARLEAYASGLFLSTSPRELDLEAKRYRAAGFRTVKMRTGLTPDEDLERLAVVRSSFRSPGAIAVDTVNAWTPEQTIAFVDAAGPLLWVEDPVPLADIPRLTEMLGDRTTLVAAGESSTDLDELVDLRTRGRVGAVLLDVQQIGGPQRFLAASSRLVALGARIGAHIFTPVSAQLLACVADPLPVEVFDWSDPLWTDPCAPGDDGRIPVGGPGLGVELDMDALHTVGRMVERRT